MPVFVVNRKRLVVEQAEVQAETQLDALSKVVLLGSRGTSMEVGAWHQVSSVLVEVSRPEAEE